MPESPVFYIGLNLAGAISAGAYTAGVMDFLIDALDTWYAERTRQHNQLGSDYDRWTVPAHDVRLAVMSGASAGGITSAISAVALCEPFQPVRNSGSGSSNRLYKSWVEDIDLKFLLGDRDLSDGSSVKSILDSTRIDEIAAEVVRQPNALDNRRPYVIDPLRVILTLTNLRGVPYAIEAGNGAEETQTLYHADQQDFEVRWTQAADGENAIQLSPRSAVNWPVLGDAAKATGAFPVALAPESFSAPPPNTITASGVSRRTIPDP